MKPVHDDLIEFVTSPFGKDVSVFLLRSVGIALQKGKVCRVLDIDPFGHGGIRSVVGNPIRSQQWSIEPGKTASAQ